MPSLLAAEAEASEALQDYVMEAEERVWSEDRR